MRILTNEPSTSIEVKRSRFIAIARRCPSLEEAKRLVAETKTQYADATHVVHAAVIGKAGTLFSSSDDREPKNTAGRPVLEVVKGSEITDICVLVVRYFGGTLLGTGGLVQAYGDAAKAVLALCQTEELVEKASFRIVLSYGQYDLAQKLLQEYGGTVTDTAFTTDVTITGTIARTQAALLQERITDTTGGQATVEITPNA
ncbi:MAG: YigZ family protein [Sphaerochaeta sp.]|jgi:uncharacterized YigZ family protein|nr:YigZ family protein [Sphaerochaeta sp.]MCI2075922.1 YigZ family protein [Sphaerochaeta sp.]MCI2097297.1 YigZ family protein [Sphaerochaeta sp.]MCI2104369.1 YigZ family protein [Sphaerochaeta sp.]